MDVKKDPLQMKCGSTPCQAQNETPINGILTGYLQVKNALVDDNGNDAANGGKGNNGSDGKAR